MDQWRLEELPAELIPERDHQLGLVMFLALGGCYDHLETKHHGATITCLAEQKTVRVFWMQKTFPRG